MPLKSASPFVRWVVRPLRILALGIGALVGAVVLLVAVALVAMDLPFARRFAARELNGILASSFKGKVSVVNVGSLHVTGVSGVDVRITAPDGTDVVTALGLRARIAPIALIASFLRQHDAFRVNVFDVDADAIDVNLDSDGSGQLKLLAAFEPRTPSPPTNGGGRPMRLEFPSVTFAHARAHGQMAGAPPLDASLDRFDGSLVVAPETTEVDIARVRLGTVGMPQGADAHGNVVAHLSIPSAAGASLNARASFDGDVGGIPATAKGDYTGDRVNATADVPEVAAERVRALVSAVPLYGPVAAHVEAHGSLESLPVVAHATLGPAAIDVHANARLVGALQATASVDARNVDLRTFSPAGPASDLGMHADARAEVKKDGTMAAHFAFTTPEGTIAGQSAPPTAFAGEVEVRPSQGPGGGGMDLGARGNVYEPGAPIAIQAHLSTGGAAPVVDFNVETHAADLRALHRIADVGSGSARLRLAGTLTLATPPSLAVAIDGVVRDFAQGDNRVDSATIGGHADGPLGAPELHVTLDGSGVRAGNYRFATAHVSTEGGLAEQRVRVALRGQNTSNIDADATLGIGPAITVDRGQVAIARGFDTLRVQIAHARVAGSAVDVSGVRMTGIGPPTELEMHIRPDSVALRGHSKGIDLKALGHLLGVDQTLRAGTFAFDTDISMRRTGADGSALLDVTDGCFGEVDGLNAHVDLKLDDRKLRGNLNAAAASMGSIAAKDIDVEIGGRGPLEISSWRRAWGKLHVDGSANLRKVADLLPANAPPLFARMAGTMSLRADIQRDSESDVTPNVDLTVSTKNLKLGGRGDPDEIRHGLVLIRPQKWQVYGIDLDLTATANGTTGAANVGLDLQDGQGLFARVHAKTADFPFAPLIASHPDAMARLMNTVFSAEIDLPKRDLAGLPQLLGLNHATGDEQGKVTLDGTCLAPKLRFDGKAHGVRLDASVLTVPLDGDLTATYDGTKGDAKLEVRSKDATLLAFAANTNAKVADFLVGDGDAARWTAGAHARLSDFPLDSIGPLSDRRMHGKASGEFELANFHDDARVRADIDVRELRVGKVQYGKASLKSKYDGRHFGVDVHLDQGTGSADAKAETGMLWGARMAPAVDPNGTTDLSLRAQHLNAGFLAPFVRSSMDEFEGTLDADARVSIAPQKKPVMSGSVSFQKGTVELAALGQELHDVRAKVAFTPDGVVRLSDVSASGTSGRLTAAGTARLDGTDLLGAEVDVKIAKRDALPVDMQGSDMGTAYGQFAIKAAPTVDRRTMNVTVNVPSMHVELPQADMHTVEDLDDTPSDVHVGVYAAPNKFVSLPLDGAGSGSPPKAPSGSQNTLKVTVQLGQDVGIKRGTDLKAMVSGNVTAEVSDKTIVRGQLHLRDGKLDVQGKSFQIETGTVTFVGDPGNPEINVTAGWNAPDGTRILADYVGPLKTGKVTLRSEPNRPQSEILAILAFGTADGSTATPYATPSPDAGTQAGTTVGGVAAGGLTQGLNKLTGVDITAKIDTNHINPRPEVAVQIARDISLQLAVVLGTPPPGENPDTTYVTVDWRFLRQWSLETTFGDMGSSIADVVWQHRY
ncbi:MAG TPA: translocation/assembly module TamB domain-containing protein [Polyangiaceae bacterium]|nr:translocation/assembly module TamB domain-containing protein [Polyangiaceae bacterium]